MALTKVLTGGIALDAVDNTILKLDDDYALTGVIDGYAEPNFEAKLGSTQTGVADNTVTKIVFGTEEFDSNSKFDNSSTSRFTPTVAGQYFVYLSIGVNASADANLENCYGHIYKNGESIKTSHFNFAGNNARFAQLNVTSIVTLDGDDYIEAYIQAADSSGTISVQSGNYTTFGAFRIGT